jgi:hypothetical protein
MLWGKRKRGLEEQVRSLREGLAELKNTLPLQVRELEDRRLEEKLTDVVRGVRKVEAEIEELRSAMDLLKSRVEAIARQINLTSLSAQERGRLVVDEGLEWQREVKRCIDSMRPELQRLLDRSREYSGKVLRVIYSDKRGEPDIVLSADADIFAVIACRALSLGGSTLVRKIYPADVRPELWCAKRYGAWLVLAVKNKLTGGVWFYGEVPQVFEEDGGKTPVELAKPLGGDSWYAPERARDDLYRILWRALSFRLERQRALSGNFS